MVMFLGRIGKRLRQALASRLRRGNWSETVSSDRHRRGGI